MRETAHFSDSVPVSTTIVNAVAEVTGTQPRELPTLYQVVDAEALSDLVAPSYGPVESEVTVEFEMAGCTVVVSSEGSVTVTDGVEPVADAQRSRNRSGEEVVPE